MIKNEKKFIQYIEELKVLGAKAIKFELESEYLPELFLKKISSILKENSIFFALKTGGFSSFNDILISKNIMSDIIIAPMVETPYALQKFFETLKLVYRENELSNKKIYINIETEFGIKNFDEILKTKNADLLEGIVIGRGDLIASTGLSRSLIDSDSIFKTITPLIEKCQKAGKKIILGGEITSKSVNFIKHFPYDTLFGFETRKVFFKTRAINSENFINSINKAINFEIFYLEMLISLQSQNAAIFKKRIAALKERL